MWAGGGDGLWLQGPLHREISEGQKVQWSERLREEAESGSVRVYVCVCVRESNIYRER